MTDTKACVYFGIKTENQELNEADFEQYLGLKATSFEKIYSRGHIPKCTIWEYSTGNLVNPIYYEAIEQIVAHLLPFKENLKKFKEAYPEVHYVFEVVIYLGDETPGLNFNLEVLSFLNEIGAEIDCDIYNKK
jgi:hypothetical protein